MDFLDLAKQRCSIRSFTDKPVEKGKLDYIQPTALLIMGYPCNGFLDPDRHQTDRKPVASIVMWEKYNEVNNIPIFP